MKLILASNLFGGQHEFFFRMPLQKGVILRHTAYPGVFDVGVGNANIKRIILDLHLRSLYLRGAQCQRGVIDSVNLDPASWLYFGGSLACRWGTCHEKLVSVGNRPMLSLSSLYQTL